MAEYNAPTNLFDEIRALGARVERLERSVRIVPTITSSLPVDFSQYRNTTSGSFTDMHVVATSVTSSSFVYHFAAFVSVADTTGEIRLVDGSNNVFKDISGADVVATIPTSLTEVQLSVGEGILHTLPFGAPLIVKAQVRRSTGTGVVNVKGQYLRQVQV